MKKTAVTNHCLRTGPTISKQNSRIFKLIVSSEHTKRPQKMNKKDYWTYVIIYILNNIHESPGTMFIWSFNSRNSCLEQANCGKIVGINPLNIKTAR